MDADGFWGCPICGYGLQTEKERDNHVKNYHTPGHPRSSTRILCYICGELVPNEKYGTHQHVHLCYMYIGSKIHPQTQRRNYRTQRREISFGDEALYVDPDDLDYTASDFPENEIPDDYFGIKRIVRSSESNDVQVNEPPSSGSSEPYRNGLRNNVSLSKPAIVFRRPETDRITQCSSIVHFEDEISFTVRNAQKERRTETKNSYLKRKMPKNEFDLEEVGDSASSSSSSDSDEYGDDDDEDYVESDETLEETEFPPLSSRITGRSSRRRIAKDDANRRIMQNFSTVQSTFSQMCMRRKLLKHSESFPNNKTYFLRSLSVQQAAASNTEREYNLQKGNEKEEKIDSEIHEGKETVDEIREEKKIINGSWEKEKVIDDVQEEGKSVDGIQKEEAVGDEISAEKETVKLPILSVSNGTRRRVGRPRKHYGRRGRPPHRSYFVDTPRICPAISNLKRKYSERKEVMDEIPKEEDNERPSVPDVLKDSDAVADADISSVDKMQNVPNQITISESLIALENISNDQTVQQHSVLNSEAAVTSKASFIAEVANAATTATAESVSSLSYYSGFTDFQSASSQSSAESVPLSVPSSSSCSPNPVSSTSPSCQCCQESFLNNASLLSHLISSHEARVHSLWLAAYKGTNPVEVTEIRPESKCPFCGTEAVTETGFFHHYASKHRARLLRTRKSVADNLRLYLQCSIDPDKPLPVSLFCRF